MTIDQVTGLVTKLGGALSVVGSIVGAVVWSNTTCIDRLAAAPQCRNAFTDVAVNQFGRPDTVQLILVGGFGGAVIGALAGFAIAAVWPSTKADLFP